MLDVNAKWLYAPVESKGEAAAVAVLSSDVEAETPVLAAGEEYAQHLSTMLHQVYGPAIGVPRIIKMLALHGKPATFFVPGRTAEHYRECMEAILESGQEIALHGCTHKPPCYSTPEEQRAETEKGLAALDKYASSRSAIARPCGRPRGTHWRSTLSTACATTPPLMDDDRPFLLDTPGGRIAELCPQWYLDDWDQYVYSARRGHGGDDQPSQHRRPALDRGAGGSACNGVAPDAHVPPLCRRTAGRLGPAGS